MLAQRLYDQTQQATASLPLGDLIDARSRRLEQQLKGPARFQFVVDGHDPTAAQIQELEHEVRVWRWDDATNSDMEMMRGVITASQDTISEQRHTVTFTCQDPLSLLGRRWATVPLTFNQVDQDTIADNLRTSGSANLTTSSGMPFGLSSALPLTFTPLDPFGNARQPSGRLRDRTYPEGTNSLEALTNLSNVIDGFDFDCRPVAGADLMVNDQLRVFYPFQGRLIENWALEYGSTVAGLSRSLSADTYANYVRVIGQPTQDPETGEEGPQVYGEGWSADALDIIANPAGTWMQSLSAADVTQVNTLIEIAAGELERNILLPNYSLQLVGGAYTPEAFDIGDVVRLRINSGRLNVDTWVRVMTRTFVIGDDGQEDVEVEVARPEGTFSELFANADQRLKALERR